MHLDELDFIDMVADAYPTLQKAMCELGIYICTLKKTIDDMKENQTLAGKIKAPEPSDIEKVLKTLGNEGVFRAESISPNYPYPKIRIIKAVRSLSSLGLKECKDLVEHALESSVNSPNNPTITTTPAINSVQNYTHDMRTGEKKPITNFNKVQSTSSQQFEQPAYDDGDDTVPGNGAMGA